MDRVPCRPIALQDVEIEARLVHVLSGFGVIQLVKAAKETPVSIPLTSRQASPMRSAFIFGSARRKRRADPKDGLHNAAPANGAVGYQRHGNLRRNKRRDPLQVGEDDRWLGSLMELMQLQMFVAAAEERSLQKAAERVHRTPQAVSMAIGKLEDELRTTLFERSSSRGFSLTAAGEVLFEHSKRALALLNEAVARVDEIRRVKGGQLRIGANQSIGEYLLPQVTHAFQAAYPNVRFKITIGYSEAMLTALRRHDVDVALVADKPHDQELKAELLMKDRLIALLNPQHRLAKQDSIALEALAGEALILLTETSELRERVVSTFRQFGVSLDPSVETGTLESIKRMVAQNMGIGIVPFLCARNEEAGRLVAKPIAQFPEDRSLWIVWPQTPSPACQAFVATVKAEVAKLQVQGPD